MPIISVKSEDSGLWDKYKYFSPKFDTPYRSVPRRPMWACGNLEFFISLKPSLVKLTGFQYSIKTSPSQSFTEKFFKYYE